MQGRSSGISNHSEMKEAIFIKFGTSDALLKKQLEYARVI